jgi:hypothetical protein
MKKGDDEDDEVRTTAKPQVWVAVKWELKNLSFGISIYSQIWPSELLPHSSRRRRGWFSPHLNQGKGRGQKISISSSWDYRQSFWDFRSQPDPNTLIKSKQGFQLFSVWRWRKLSELFMFLTIHVPFYWFKISDTAITK